MARVFVHQTHGNPRWSSDERSLTSGGPFEPLGRAASGLWPGLGAEQPKFGGDVPLIDEERCPTEFGSKTGSVACVEPSDVERPGLIGCA